MEVRINKEVRDYQEAVFFGLSLRQFVFSVLAIGISVALYFPLSRIVGDVEMGSDYASWGRCPLLYAVLFATTA